MAKQRTNFKKKNNNKGSFAEYSTEGMMTFECSGYVQDVKEGDEVDYVKFNIDNPFVKGNVNTFSIDVPWSDDLPQLELGDNVNVFGLIRSWWNNDLGRVTYSFVAQQVEVVDPLTIQQKDPDPPKKTRRGTAKNNI